MIRLDVACRISYSDNAAARLITIRCCARTRSSLPYQNVLRCVVGKVFCRPIGIADLDEVMGLVIPERRCAALRVLCLGEVAAVVKRVSVGAPQGALQCGSCAPSHRS